VKGVIGDHVSYSNVADVRRKLLQYVRAHNRTCHPFVRRDPEPRCRSAASPIGFEST